MMGFVIEAIQQRVSADIGSCLSMSASPRASQCRMRSLVATTVTTPDAWWVSIIVFIAAVSMAVWLVRMWKSRTVVQPLPRPNLDAVQLDALRKQAREETEF